MQVVRVRQPGMPDSQEHQVMAGGFHADVHRSWISEFASWKRHHLCPMALRDFGTSVARAIVNDDDLDFTAVKLLVDVCEQFLQPGSFIEYPHHQTDIWVAAWIVHQRVADALVQPFGRARPADWNGFEKRGVEQILASNHGRGPMRRHVAGGHYPPTDRQLW